MQISWFTQLQTIISPKPLLRAKFRANFWPLQGPQNSTTTIPMNISQAKFGPHYANELLINNNHLPNQLPQ